MNHPNKVYSNFDLNKLQLHVSREKILRKETKKNIKWNNIGEKSEIIANRPNDHAHTHTQAIAERLLSIAIIICTFTLKRARAHAHAPNSYGPVRPHEHSITLFYVSLFTMMAELWHFIRY